MINCIALVGRTPSLPAALRQGGSRTNSVRQGAGPPCGTGVECAPLEAAKGRMMMNNKKVALLGAGNMGRAIVLGMLASGKYDAKNIVAADRSQACRDILSEKGVAVFELSADATNGADIVILATKPNGLETLASEMKDSIKCGAVLVSICAGKTISSLEALFGEDKKIVRVMPNTPAMVGVGMSALCVNKNVSKDELDEIVAIFSSFGYAEVVEEELMHTVTGISGSGPAYAFMFIDCLAKAAVQHGMTKEQAKKFAAQTVLGAAKMVLESDVSPEQLKINVCSPGGTTIEAVKVFDECDLEGIVKNAVTACINKSKWMSEQ